METLNYSVSKLTTFKVESRVSPRSMKCLWSSSSPSAYILILSSGTPVKSWSLNLKSSIRSEYQTCILRVVLMWNSVEINLKLNSIQAKISKEDAKCFLGQYVLKIFIKYFINSSLLHMTVLELLNLLNVLA